MNQKPLDRVLGQHPFAAGLSPDMLSFLAGCSKNERFATGEYLFREGERASKLFLIRHGRVTFESHAPGRGTVILETLEDGDALGWSALFEPYVIDGRAVHPTSAFSVDGECLLRKMEADPAFGYRVARRLLELTHVRLQRSRLQRLDVYRSHR